MNEQEQGAIGRLTDYCTGCYSPYNLSPENRLADLALIEEGIKQRDRAIRILSEWHEKTQCCGIEADVVGCAERKCVECAIVAAMEAAKEKGGE